MPLIEVNPEIGRVLFVAILLFGMLAVYSITSHLALHLVLFGKKIRVRFMFLGIPLIPVLIYVRHRKEVGSIRLDALAASNVASLVLCAFLAVLVFGWGLP